MSNYEQFIFKPQDVEFIKRNIDKIGQKASGLINTNQSLVPKYIILSSSLFKIWKENAKQAIEKLESFVPELEEYFGSSKIIIRSSAKKEAFNERGFYESSSSGVIIKEYISEIIRIWEKNLPMVDSIPYNEFSLILQEYIHPKLLGHLSNERRLCKRKESWFYEIMDFDELVENSQFTIKKRSQNNINTKCINKKELVLILKNIASCFCNQRSHIEWIWNGRRIYIVQNDTENKVIEEYEPGSEWKQKGNIVTAEEIILKHLKKIEKTRKKWEKISCVQTFLRCKLPIGNIYILEGEKELRAIKNNIFPKRLESELSWLLTFPIVIRIDIDTDTGSKFLLPRTETLSSLSDVKCFLSTNTQKLSNEKIGLNSICFLFHRFIISKSCALAFSKPDIPRIRIDSTWGIVDGLYYHPHDSFEVNTNDDSIKKRIRCKTEYLDVDKNGQWLSKKADEKHDWKESLTKSQIKRIALYNEKLTSFLKKPVTVMYFVGILKETGYQAILPWFYTTEEIPDASEKFSEVVFSEKKVIIKCTEDFDRIKSDILKLKQKNKITLKLKLNPDFLRDREFIEEVGIFSKNYQIPIEIEGSILSHPYYILKKQNAVVKAKNPFDPIYTKQEFYKLVRDKVPILIESKGEAVKILQITTQQTLELIKQKLIEEVYECFWEHDSDKIMEELADIYELIRAASKIFGAQISEIKKIADNKRDKRGGFEKGTFLVETKEEALIEIINKKEDKESIPLTSNNIKLVSKESLIPKYKKSTYSNNEIIVPYIPVLVNKETLRRTEKLRFDKENDLFVSFKEKSIHIKIVSRKEQIDKNQLKLKL